MATTCFRCDQPENTVFYAADGTMRSAAPQPSEASRGAGVAAEVAGSDPKTVIPVRFSPLDVRVMEPTDPKYSKFFYMS